VCRPCGLAEQGFVPLLQLGHGKPIQFCKFYAQILCHIRTSGTHLARQADPKGRG
jgi:hypothetical protein